MNDDLEQTLYNDYMNKGEVKNDIRFFQNF